ncbi:MAG: Imm8 family immunity protein [Propionibacteriaceae bacterium]
MSTGVTADIKEIIYYWPWGGTEPPTGSQHFAVTVQVLIGQVGEDLADSFDIMVFSPSMLAERYRSDHWDEDDVLPGGTVQPLTGVWLMKAWSRAELEAAIQRVVPAFSPAPDFETVAHRISRVIPWEYEYERDAAVNQAAGLPDTSASFWHDA